MFKQINMASVLIVSGIMAIAMACASAAPPPGIATSEPTPISSISSEYLGESVTYIHDSKRGVGCWKARDGTGVGISCLADYEYLGFDNKAFRGR